MVVHCKLVEVVPGSNTLSFAGEPIETVTSSLEAPIQEPGSKPSGACLVALKWLVQVGAEVVLHTFHYASYHVFFELVTEAFRSALPSSNS